MKAQLVNDDGEIIDEAEMPSGVTLIKLHRGGSGSFLGALYNR